MTRQIIWNLPSPLSRTRLDEAGAVPTLVQFAGLPSNRDHALLGAWLADKPETTVRFSATDMSDNLGFLQYYDGAHRVFIDLSRVTSFEGVTQLRSDLTSLGLGSTASKRPSLKPLHHFTHLKRLAIVGHTRGLDTVSRLESLQELALLSLSLPALTFVQALVNLVSLELKLGGTTNLDALPALSRLRYLEIFRVLGLQSLDVIASIPSLQYLFLQHQARVQALPSLKHLPVLRRVHIDKLSSLHDLRPLAEAPRLQELLLLDMPQLSIDAFRVLVGHPSLRALTAGVSNDARRHAIKELVGVPDVTSYGTDFVFESPGKAA